jgi:hypothetical protein
MYLRIRNLCGLLGIILPWLALFSAGIADHSVTGGEWWWSISATYYLTPALVGVLVPACIVLISYIGYDWTDNLLTTLAGLFGLCIVLFPCSVRWLPAGTRVGFFQLPMEASQIIHTVCSCLFFVLNAVIAICQFTKHGNNVTPRKLIRNKVYRICGYGMLGVMVVFAVTRLLNAPRWTVMIIEIILLHLYGFAWLTKGEAFPFLNDKEE